MRLSGHVNTAARQLLPALLLCSTVFANGSTKETGIPLFQYYSPKDYQAFFQNWAMVQDARGILYVGNSNGVLEYDGARWRTIPLKNKGIVFALGLGPDGRIYAGSTGDFGVLAPDHSGSLSYSSLLDKVPEKERGFTQVLSIITIGKTIFFISTEKLFRYQNGSIKVWKAPSKFNNAIKSEDTLYLDDRALGLLRMQGENPEIYIPRARLPFKVTTALKPWKNTNGEKCHILASHDSGLFIWHKNKFYPFKTEFDHSLKRHRIFRNSIEMFPDNSLVIGNYSGGLAHISPSGKLLSHLGKREGLPEDKVHPIFSDHHGNLWLTLGRGFCKLEISSPLSILDDRSGLNGYVFTIKRHKGKLFVATSQGAFVMTDSPYDGRGWFMPWKEGLGQITALCAVRDDLLIGTVNNGLWHIKDKSNAIFQERSEIYTIIHSKKDPRRIYFGSIGNIISARKEGDTWIDEGIVAECCSPPRSIVEMNDGSLWVGTLNQGVFHIQSPEKPGKCTVKQYGLDKGFSGLQFNNVYLLKCGLRVATKGGIYRHDENADRFEKDPAFANLFEGGDRWLYALTEDKEGRIWMHSAIDKINESGFAEKKPDGSYRWESAACRRFAGDWIESIYPEDTGVIWLGGSEGLFRLDSNIKKDYKKPFSIFIRSITTGDRLIYNGNPTNPRKNTKLPYSENAVRFEFAAPFFEMESATRYQVRLAGSSGSWSEWTKESYRDYTNLSEGNYTFHVRAKNLYGTLSDTDSFIFTILPPWYRHWAAYLGYGILASGTLWLLTRWRIKKLVKERDALEMAVLARTAELEQINAIASSINKKMDFNELMTSILNEAMIIKGIQRAAALVLDEDRGIFHIKATVGWKPGQFNNIELPPGICEARYVMGAESTYPELFLVKDINNRAGNEYLKTLEISKVMLVIRVKHEDKADGYFVFSNMEDENAFSASDIKLLNGLKEHFIAAFIKARSILHLEASRKVAEAESQAALKAREMEKEARITAEEATKSKSEFLANMSHELRTPMNAIIGFSTLALQMEIPIKLRDFVYKISNSAHNLLSIINDILDFSKLEAGKLNIESIPFNLEEVLNNACDIFALKAAEKGIELTIISEPNVPMFLFGDPLRLGQILINLTNNAMKFTHSGFVAIRVSMRDRTVLESGEDLAELRFSIQDSGIGMTPEQMERLFQAFSQADASTTRKYGGTGLGLAISQRLVELMGGKIDVESKYGEGSCFHFTLGFPVDLSRKSKIYDIPDTLKSLRVLVVDDTEAARSALATQLEAFHFQVETAKHGFEALEKLENAQIPLDLVFMDYQMPKMDGVETTKRIQENPKIPKKPAVVMVTGFGREEVIAQAQKVGIQGFLIKPVMQSLLLDAVMVALGYKGAMDFICASGGTAPSKGEQAIRGTYLLLAEDNEINQQVAVELLRRAGVKVDVAVNGLEAVKMVDCATYDAVLMDVQMPEMDGYAATQLIREKAAHAALPIIAMTAHAISGYREECLASGMNDYVTKPINPDQLFSVLAKWVRTIGRNAEPRKIFHEDFESAGVELESADITRKRVAVEFSCSPSARRMFQGHALVADDSLTCRSMVETLLNRHGLTVRTAENGEAAIQWMETEEFDIVFLDGRMPKLDGRATLKEIRKRESSLWTGRRNIVVVLTGLTSSEDKKRLLASGFDDYLAKPLKDDALQEVLLRRLQTPLQKQVMEYVCDWDRLTDILGGREKLLDFLSIFIKDSSERYLRMQNAIKEENRHQLRREAHDLKANAAMLGFTSLSNHCMKLEKEVISIEDSDLRQRVEELGILLENAQTACRDRME